MTYEYLDHKEEKEGPVCPKCGAIGGCTHEYNVVGDLATDLIDRFTFKCGGCDYIKEETVNSFESGHEDEVAPCPFCGKTD